MWSLNPDNYFLCLLGLLFHLVIQGISVPTNFHIKDQFTTEPILLGEEDGYKATICVHSYVPKMETLKWTLLLFMTYIAVLADHDEGAELELHFTKEDTILISEDDYVNVTFWLSPAKSERCHDDFYIIEVQTRCSDGRVEYEGRVLRWNETCKVSYQQSVRCISETGPAELYRKVKCSKMDIEWVWTWKDCESGKLKSKEKNMKLFKESYSLESRKNVTPIIIGTCIAAAVLITTAVTGACLLLRLQKTVDSKREVDPETSDCTGGNRKENNKFLEQEAITMKKPNQGHLSKNGGKSCFILFSIISAFKTFPGVVHLCKLRVMNYQFNSSLPVNQRVL